VNISLPVEPVGLRPLGSISAAMIYTRSIMIDVAHRLLHRRQRSRGLVLADYDQGEWSDQLRARGWERSRSLQEYVVDRGEREIYATVNGQLSRMVATQYYRYRAANLISLLKEFSRGAETIVELGSGSGNILFTISLERHWAKLIGLELSKSGRQIMEQVRDHFHLDTIEAGYIDLLDESLSDDSRLAGATVFTHYCLEQLPDFTEHVLRQLVRAGIARAIHIEPTPELFGWSLKDLATRAYIWRQDYQRTLVKTVRKLESEGLIRVVEVRRLHFASSWRNDPTLVVWEPVTERPLQ
jgi:hypothetical protein